MRRRAEAWTARAQAGLVRLEDERPNHASVEVGFRLLVNDRRIAGGVLGGGLAYRLFFWVLALTLLVCGGLGFADHAGDNVTTAATDAGLTTAVAGTISNAAQQSDSGRWWLLLIGTYLTLWFSWSLLRALRLVHAAAWGVPVTPLRNAPRALACVLAAPIVLGVTVWAAGWVRANDPSSLGLVATLAVGAVLAALWLAVSRNLPSEEVPWTALVPGALVVAVGLEALHLFVVYFLANKLASSSSLYGGLGLAGTMLFTLFLIGRGIIGAAELNAVVWDVRSERGRQESNLRP